MTSQQETLRQYMAGEKYNFLFLINKSSSSSSPPSEGNAVHDETCPLLYSFLIIQTVGRTPWAGDQHATRSLSIKEKNFTMKTLLYTARQSDGNTPPLQSVV
jgi:hypothetical protein